MQCPHSLAKRFRLKLIFQCFHCLFNSLLPDKNADLWTRHSIGRFRAWTKRKKWAIKLKVKSVKLCNDRTERLTIGATEAKRDNLSEFSDLLTWFRAWFRSGDSTFGWKGFGGEPGLGHFGSRQWRWKKRTTPQTEGHRNFWKDSGE